MWRIFTDCDLNSHLERTFGFFSNENVIEFSLPIISEMILTQLPIYDEGFLFDF